MTYQIAICDDDAATIQHLSSVVADWGTATGNFVQIDAFPSAEAFLFRYADDKNYDILMLDIEMDGMNGVQLARKIRAENDAVQIVFITGYPEFVLEGYDVSALHYLIKPVGKGKLFSVLDRAARILGKAERAVIFEVDGEALRVKTRDIMRVEAFAHNCVVTTANTAFEVRFSISEIENMLGDGFIRCHRSYLVGLKYIKSISKKEITLDNGDQVPLSRGNYGAVNQAFIRSFKGE